MFITSAWAAIVESEPIFHDPYRAGRNYTPGQAEAERERARQMLVGAYEELNKASADALAKLATFHYGAFHEGD